MRPLLFALALWLAVAATAAARNPRLEQLALRSADTAFARNAVVRSSDLGSGWTTRPTKPDDAAAPDCAAQDYSKFTITGRAQTQSSRGGARVISRVQVFRSRADALGDFAVDAKPGTAACEGAAVREEWSASGIPTTLVSARQLPAPTVGQRSVAFRIVLGVRSGDRRLRVYIDVIGFVRGRTVASVVVLAPGTAPRGHDVLARKIDSRLQGAA